MASLHIISCDTKCKVYISLDLYCQSVVTRYTIIVYGTIFILFFFFLIRQYILHRITFRFIECLILLSFCILGNICPH